MASSAAHSGAYSTPQEHEQRPCGRTTEAVDRLERLAQQRDHSRRLAMSRLAKRYRVPVGMLAAPWVGPPAPQDGRMQPTPMLPTQVGDADASGGQDRPGRLVVLAEALRLVGEQPAIGAATAHLRTLACTPEAVLGDRDRAYRWRRPVLGAPRPGHIRVQPAEPYLVLDLSEFTARCRSCLWQSAPYSGLVEAQFAYSMHACPADPIAARAEVVA
jgi:hypothetical protein